MTTLFFGRLGLYLLLVVVPSIHPAVLRYMDALSLQAYFIIVPVSALLAFYGDRLPRRKRLSGGLLAEIGLLAAGVALGGWSLLNFGYLAAGAYAYLSTRLIFKWRWTIPFYLEPFAFFFIVYKIIGLSKASPEIAATAAPFNLAFGFMAVYGFLIYTFLIYRTEFYREDDKIGLKEALLPPLAFLPLALLIALAISPDAIDHIPILNNLDNILEPRPKPVAENGSDSELDGNLLGEKGKNGRNKLKTLPGSSWSDRGDSGGSSGNQYLVMVVRSAASPLYLSERYLNRFDPEDGFRYDPTYPLNGLSSRQFMESWQNIDPPADQYRREVRIDVYSTLSSEPSAYLPTLLEPVVKNDRYYPISFSYRAQSLVSEVGLRPAPWPVRTLNEDDKQALTKYLSIDLPAEYAERYSQYVAGMKLPNAYLERIDAVLRSFSSFQYQIGFTEDTSTAAISAFCFTTKTGDCTEFSAAAALIGRLAGIPARVVTGYILADELRTRAHLQGLRRLQQSFPPLADAPLRELYLITNAHKHAWVQYYLPDFGWVDFESTQYALPPPAGMDPNDLDVVIPTITVREKPPVYVFPWRQLLTFAAGLIGAAIAYVYLRRWTHLARLLYLSRKPNERGAKALYLLLLVRLAARKYPVKPPDLTAREFAARYPELSTFAALYNQCVYAVPAAVLAAVPATRYAELRAEYRRILKAKRSFPAVLKEIFSLRDLRLL